MGQRRNLKANKKYTELNENENTPYKNMWDTANAVHRAKFVALNAYIWKIFSQINNLSILKKLEKEEKNPSKQKEINKKDKNRN